MAHAMGATEFEQRFDGLFRTQAHDLGAKIPGALFIFKEMALQSRVDPVIRFPFGLYMNHEPIGV